MERLEGNMQSQSGVLGTQQDLNLTLMLQLDALEAENIRLKAQMQAQETGIKQARTRDDLLRLYNTEAP